MRFDEENLTDGRYDVNDLTGRAGGFGGDFSDLSYMDDYDDEDLDSGFSLSENHEGDDAEIVNYLKTSRADDLVNEAGQNLTAEDMEKMLVQEGFSVDDPVRLYLKEIGKIPLLSANFTISLSKLASHSYFKSLFSTSDHWRRA